MNYNLVIEILKITEEFELDTTKKNASIDDFIKWIAQNKYKEDISEPDWEGKENGRSPESIINTLIISMNRYAKFYSKSILQGSDFASQEDFIYLINLKALGSMSKMQLIKKNLQDKATGIQIINRLLKNEWIEQKSSTEDKRSHLIQITTKGKEYLELSMQKIRKATNIVAGDLDYQEKMQLIYLLDKLDKFHNKIYFENQTTEDLLENVTNKYLKNDQNKT
ncbi:MarR family transcriptional regulator [Paenimyroides tangerinum]|uniref:MarR family transcriptional regulator n=1 Tax=Paenimyroides tangerinum TaxID=2488728 RepID=A0A3P3W758_9FLAO|nr:winged helix DNA-binding protein [Paenimyroides tangerinum]RRJ91011.1 MarR family transcriptional regulator [Paenimyroides tangerinum]